MKCLLVRISTFVLALSLPHLASAQSYVWNNGSGNFAWDTSSSNWVSGTFVNPATTANFNATGVGAISVNEAITLRNMIFSVTGYSFGGPGSINFTPTSYSNTGSITIGSAAANDATLVTINAIINSSCGLSKSNGGILELGGTNTITGSIANNTTGLALYSDVQIGNTISTAGTLRLLNANALQSTARVSIGTGFLDIGANTITLKQLIFESGATTGPWTGPRKA